MKRYVRTCALVAAILTSGLSPSAAAETRADSDPLEFINRPVFWFNEQADRYVLEPVARAWDWLIPDPAKRAVSRFFRNLETPTLVANNLLQAKPRQAAIDVTRFAFNSTFGIAGLFDPAGAWGLPRVEEDFGQTLGYWGVPPGPYLVLPLLGPETLRDGIARPMNTATAIYPWFVSGLDTAGLTVVDLVNWRAESLEQIATLRSGSLDFYAATRNAYLQRRQALVSDGAVATAEEEDDLYFFDDEEDE